MRLQQDERRQQLLELGGHLFNTRSYDDVSIDDIAAAAGISKGLLYHYFPSKRELYVANIRLAAGRLVEATRPDTSLPPTERLQASLDAYLTYVEQNVVGYSSLMRSGIGTDPEVGGVIEQTRTEILDSILENLGVSEPAPTLALGLWGWLGFVESACLRWAEHHEVSREAIRNVLVAVFQATLVSARRE
jgi:AcrR family transcriptional regulator